jgi:superoxide reductase
MSGGEDMKDRRDFLKASVALAAGMVVSGASKAIASSGTYPAGIIYTADNPGQWAKKVGGHAPMVTKDGFKITITTNHSMSEIHYIVRHTLVAEDGTVIGSQTFSPDDEKPVSTYDLYDFSGNPGSKVYATSFCNLHDFWLTELKL